MNFFLSVLQNILLLNQFFLDKEFEPNLCQLIDKDVRGNQSHNLYNYPNLPTKNLKKKSKIIFGIFADINISHKIDYVAQAYGILKLKGHQKYIIFLKVTAILLKGWILPTEGVASGRVCACSLRSRLVSHAFIPLVYSLFFFCFISLSLISLSSLLSLLFPNTMKTTDDTDL